MEAKDVKVGMKVVPHDKTFGDYDGQFAEWVKSDLSGAKDLRNNGFLTVKDSWSNGLFNLNNNCLFNASDFSPATIEVGDTVRAINGGGSTATIVRIEGRYAWPRWKDGSSSRWVLSDFELIRKAKKPCICEACRASEISGICHTDYWTCPNYKPEPKKEDKPVSKKPRLEEITLQTLCKTRRMGLLAPMVKDGKIAFFNALKMRGESGEVGRLDQFSIDLKCPGADAYDIVATKIMPLQIDVIRAVLSDTEPAWDWTEDMDKPVFKVGDWVEVCTTNMTRKPIGKRGRVDHIMSGVTYPIYVDFGNGDVEPFAADHLKPCTAPSPRVISAAEAMATLKKQYGDNIQVDLKDVR